MSIAPDLSASKRSLADNGVNLTLLASLKIAAATARQKSTSNPDQAPFSSAAENPKIPWLTPQLSAPRSFTAASVCAEAVPTARTSATAGATRDIKRFMADSLPCERIETEDRVALHLGGMAHDHLGADRYAVVQVHDVVIDEAKAARRYGMTDRVRLVGAVDAVDGGAEVEGTCAQRVARAPGHPARQIRLSRNHLGGRCPVRPFRLACDLQEPGPLEAFPADADAVAYRPVVALHEIHVTLRRVDNDRAGRLGGAEEHDLLLKRRVDALFL